MSENENRPDARTVLSPVQRLQEISGDEIKTIPGRPNPVNALASPTQQVFALKSEIDIIQRLASDKKVVMRINRLRFKPQALTKHQAHILSSVAEGKDKRAIAEEHDMSPNTVKSTLNTIFQKLRVQDRTEAVMAAYTSGDLVLDSEITIKNARE